MCLFSSIRWNLGNSKTTSNYTVICKPFSININSSIFSSSFALHKKFTNTTTQKNILNSKLSSRLSHSLRPFWFFFMCREMNRNKYREKEEEATTFNSAHHNGAYERSSGCNKEKYIDSHRKLRYVKCKQHQLWLTHTNETEIQCVKWAPLIEMGRIQLLDCAAFAVVLHYVMISADAVVYACACFVVPFMFKHHVVFLQSFIQM